MAPLYDLVIHDALIIDGTLAPRYVGSIALKAGKIAAIGDIKGANAGREIDARGLTAAPGFIDVHTHDDRLLLSSPEMAPKASQGVTTVVTGNCGISLACSPTHAVRTPPLDLLDNQGDWFRFPSFAAYREELAAKPSALNAACLIGHTALRATVMDDLNRVATKTEIARMRDLAREALASGAIGISTGTAYAPAAAATTEEIIAVCQPLGEFGGVYVTHMRNEDARITEAIDETTAIGRALNAPVIISHHKCAGVAQHGRSRDTLQQIERAMREQQVGLDCYPYVASSTILKAERLAQSTRVIVTWSKPHPEVAGLDLDAAAAKLGLSIHEAVNKLQPAGAIYFMLDEQDVRRILAFGETMIGSDGLPHDAVPHPRLWGTFPRVLGHYCREEKLFSLETAVYKMTGLPAKKFGLKNRGVLSVGAHADITLFDAASVIDAADFTHPTRPARGIHTVVVNGELVWCNGAATGRRPGQLLART